MLDLAQSAKDPEAGGGLSVFARRPIVALDGTGPAPYPMVRK